MNPLVSVLIPVYNHERFLKQSIMSVLNQTYSNVELIVINDGSTDNSDLVIKQLLEHYDFAYSVQKNKGLVNTLNSLKTMATGKYVSILASDDYFHEEKIADLVSFLETNKPFSMVYSNMFLVDDNSMLVGKIKDGGSSGDLFEAILCGEFFLNSLTTLIKKDVFDEFIYDDCYIEDLQMWLKIARKYKIGYVDEFYSYYRVNNALSLSSNIFKMQEAEYGIISKYCGEVSYPNALNSWNIRWFGSFAKCNKSYAIHNFLLKIILIRNFVNIKFYVAGLKLLLPCSLFKK
jgi:alpha-1,3-rhamnosyltransferase